MSHDAIATLDEVIGNDGVDFSDSDEDEDNDTQIGDDIKVSSGKTAVIFISCSWSCPLAFL